MFPDGVIPGVNEPETPRIDTPDLMFYGWMLGSTEAVGGFTVTVEYNFGLWHNIALKPMD
jgi:hypothetical protein